jgi:DNA polymerase III delta prime subunit
MKNQHKQHHAFVIEAEAEKGIEIAEAWTKRELGVGAHGNPDVVVLRYGLLTVADARRVADTAAGAPFAGEHKVVIISASRAYHEAQNALLKIFEEPPPGTYLFLILPSLGGLLPTLRSRVQILSNINVGRTTSHIPEVAEKFISATREKRTALIKKLAAGSDDDERRSNREEAIAIVNGVEALAYQKLKKGGNTATVTALLSDIAELRSHLYDRSAPVRMILEHLSLVTPKSLIQ